MQHTIGWMGGGHSTDPTYFFLCLLLEMILNCHSLTKSTKSNVGENQAVRGKMGGLGVSDFKFTTGNLHCNSNQLSKQNYVCPYQSIWAINIQAHWLPVCAWQFPATSDKDLTDDDLASVWLVFGTCLTGVTVWRQQQSDQYLTGDGRKAFSSEIVSRATYNTPLDAIKKLLSAAF